MSCALRDRLRTGSQSARPIFLGLLAIRAAGMNREDLAMLDAMARVSRYWTSDGAEDRHPGTGAGNTNARAPFADLAMLQLRRALASSAHYHAEATKLLIACRDRRDRQNRQFAEALAGGYEAPFTRRGWCLSTGSGSESLRRFGSVKPRPACSWWCWTGELSGVPGTPPCALSGQRLSPSA